LHDLASRLLADRTVIMVTHDPLEALRLADRILILQGEPARLVSIPVPEGARPRPLDNVDLQHRQSELVTRLQESAHA
ncbi:MAG: ABC transporter ATP-binding protein, partial [Pseudomonadota bacterium]|nr:ABC transporter ATP-binding protein [Pseudomonadota bacterium]